MKNSMRTIGTRVSIGPLKTWVPKMIRSNLVKECLSCSIEITQENDSGWEGFTEDGITTQPLCRDCDQSRSVEGAKVIASLH